MHRASRYSRNVKLDAKHSCEKNYHTNRLSIETRDAAYPSRASLVHFDRPGSVTFQGWERRRDCANMWRLQVVFVRMFRAFLGYILPAGGSSAINITRDSEPSVRLVAKGLKTTGRIGRESNSFPSQSFLTPHPSPLSLRAPFLTVVLLQLVYIYLCLSWQRRSTYFRTKCERVIMSNSLPPSLFPEN